MKVIKIGTQVGDVQVQDINSMLSIRGLIEGPWETTTPAEFQETDIALCCGKNGLLKGLSPNYNLYPFFYVGTCVFVHYDGFNYKSLSDDEITFIRKWLKYLDNGHLYEVNI